MATLAELVIKLVGDASSFEKTAGGVAKTAKNLGKGMTAAGKKATLGLTVPILAAGVAAVSLASNYEENLSKVNVVFDKNAKRVERWSKQTATALGISQSKALEAAGTFGNLFRAMDVVPEAATDMSIGLVNLAADLASFNDLDPEDVLLKLQSGLTGQSMPLRSLGVNLSAAGTEVKAFELGLEDANGELSEAALLQARYAVILEQTTLAQGDFARTSEGLANTQRQLKAEFADMGVEMGQILLPIALELAGSLRKLVSSFSNLSPSTKKTIVVVAGLVAVVGPLLIILGSVVGAVGTLIPLLGFLVSPIGLVIVAIVALGLIIFKFKDEIIAGFTIAWNFIKNSVENIIGAFKEMWTTITSINWLELGANVLKGIANGLKSGLASLGQGVKDVGSTLVSGFKSFFKIGSPSILMDGEVGMPIGQGVIEGAAAGIQAGSGTLGNMVDNLIGNLKSKFGLAKGAQSVGGDISKPSKAEQIMQNNIARAAGGVEDFRVGSGTRNIFGTQDEAHLTRADMIRGAKAQVGFGADTGIIQTASAGGGSFRGGGELQKGGGDIQVIVNNPVPERASETIPRELQKLAFLGVTK